MVDRHDFQADGPGIVGSDICTVCGKEREDHEPREWLIRKDGYYYRPNCSGYTTSKFEAGRYTKSEAEREAAVESWHMKAIHQDDVEDDPVSSRVRMDTARIAELEAEVERLTKERDAALKLLPEGGQSPDSSENAAQPQLTAPVRERNFIIPLAGSLDNQPATPEDHKAASAASVDPDGIWERAYAETAGVQPDFLAGEQSGETGPGAPEARQDDEPVAWRYRWRDGGDWKLSFHFDDGFDPEKYEQQPLFTRPAEQAVTAAARRVLEWVYPIAGDNRNEADAKEEIDSVAALMAAMEAGRHD